MKALCNEARFRIEQLGITAKFEARKELHADFLLTADQRH